MVLSLVSLKFIGRSTSEDDSESESSDILSTIEVG